LGIEKIKMINQKLLNKMNFENIKEKDIGKEVKFTFSKNAFRNAKVVYKKGH